VMIANINNMTNHVVIRMNSPLFEGSLYDWRL
jgi:hypothetical protein